MSKRAKTRKAPERVGRNERCLGATQARFHVHAPYGYHIEPRRVKAAERRAARVPHGCGGADQSTKSRLRADERALDELKSCGVFCRICGVCLPGAEKAEGRQRRRGSGPQRGRGRKDERGGRGGGQALVERLAVCTPRGGSNAEDRGEAPGDGSGRERKTGGHSLRSVKKRRRTFRSKSGSRQGNLLQHAETLHSSHLSFHSRTILSERIPNIFHSLELS